MSFTKLALGFFLSQLQAREAEASLVGGAFNLAASIVNFVGAGRGIGKAERSVKSVISHTGQEVTMVIEKTNQVLRGNIELFADKSNEFMVNFGEQGKLLIREVGSEVRITADEIITSISKESQINIRVASIEMQAVIGAAGREIQASLVLLPMVARLTAENAQAGFFYGLAENTIGVSTSRRMIHQLRAYAREGRWNYEKAIGYVFQSNQAGLTPSEKAKVYVELINICSAQIDLEQSERIRIFLGIGTVAYNDPVFRQAERSPSGIVANYDLINLRTIIDAMTAPEARDILLTRNVERFVDYFSEYQISTGGEETQTSSPPKFLNHTALADGLESVPLGTVVMLPSDAIPEGYQECNGSELEVSDFPGLHTAIGSTYGERSQDGKKYFKLPDYRGYFLRGRDHGAGIDPNAVARKNRGDGVTGDEVGTVQAALLGEHSHDIQNYLYYGGSSYELEQQGAADGQRLGVESKKTNVVGGSETRPINKNVIFVIKVKDDAHQLAVQAAKNLVGELNGANLEISALAESLFQVQRDIAYQQSLFDSLIIQREREFDSACPQTVGLNTTLLLLGMVNLLWAVRSGQKLVPAFVSSLALSSTLYYAASQIGYASAESILVAPMYPREIFPTLGDEAALVPALIDDGVNRSTSPLFDRWHGPEVDTDAMTGQPQFAFTFFLNDKPVGSATFYGHPLFCRSHDGTRHNVVHSTGAIQSAVDIVRPDELADECLELPPTSMDRVLDGAMKGAVLGGLRGIGNVVGLYYSQRGFSSRQVFMIKQATYYLSYCLASIGLYLLQSNDLYDSSAAIQHGLLKTIQLMLVGIVFGALDMFCYFATLKLKAFEYEGAAGIADKVASVSRVGLFAWRAKEQGVAGMMSGVVAGVLTEGAVECVGAKIL